MIRSLEKIKNRVLYSSLKYFRKSLNRYLSELFFRFKFIPDFIIDEKNFHLIEKLGFHITTTHFYQPLPVLSEINENFWSIPLPFQHVNMDKDSMIRLLNTFSTKYKKEFDLIPITKDQQTGESQFYIQNGNFTSVDSEVLFCMIREFQPKAICEIGSGFSTILISEAITKNRIENQHQNIKSITIDPYPRDSITGSLHGKTSFLKEPVQHTDPLKYKELNENDILFIDSSHVLKYDNDVYFEIFKILPNLNKGVIIHFHDIFLPFHYPKEWVYEKRWIWDEQYFLLAFLMFNNSFEIIWASSCLHSCEPSLLEASFLSYDRNTSIPGSLWIRKIKD